MSDAERSRAGAVTDIQIPRAMVEAAARRWWEILTVDPRTPWEERDERDRQHDRDQVTLILVAALGVCDVHEESRSVFADGEWSVWMPPGDFSHWRRWRASFREMEPVAWDEHRLSITTPAEQVDTEGAST